MNIEELIRSAWNNGMSSYHDTKTDKQLKIEEDNYIDDMEDELKLFSLHGVSSSSRKTILQSLNNTLKYGKKLLVHCDDNDEQGQIDIWRTNEEIEQAIKEVESYR